MPRNFETIFPSSLLTFLSCSESRVLKGRKSFCNSVGLSPVDLTRTAGFITCTPMHHTGIKLWLSVQTSDPHRVVIWYYGINKHYLANYSEGKFFFKWPNWPKCPKSLFFTKTDGRWLSFLICSFFLR